MLNLRENKLKNSWRPSRLRGEKKTKYGAVTNETEHIALPPETDSVVT
jgi:hypothetical protein